MAGKDESIPGGRWSRTAKVGSVIGSQGARYAGTRAANVVRSKDRATEALDGASPRGRREDGRRTRRAQGRGDEDRPARVVHRYGVPAARVPRAVPGQARRPADAGSSHAVEEGQGRARRGVGGSRRGPVSRTSITRAAAAAASIGQVHRATLPDGRRVAVKIQYPGVAKALRADMQNAGMILRLAKALAPGARREGRGRGAQGARARGARLRVRGAEPACVLTRLSRPPVHLRARRDHAALAQPRARDGVGRRHGLRRRQAAAAGGARPLRRDRLPLLLRLDLPPAALQRRRTSRQLHPHGGRQGRVSSTSV